MDTTTGRPTGLVTPEYLKRAREVRENRKAPRYGQCGHKLRADNDGPLCDPCLKTYLENNPINTGPTKKREPRNGGVRLYGLEKAKKDSGLSWRKIGKELGGKNWQTVRLWAVTDRATPAWAIPKLTEVLGVTQAQLEGKEE